MRRIAIGSIAIVLLASLQCEPQETKVGPLTRLRQAYIVIEPLSPDAKKLGLSIRSLESQMLVGLRRDIPRLAIREGVIPNLYLRVTILQERTVEGRELGFAAFVNLQVTRPATILEDGAIGEVMVAMLTVWESAVLLTGSRRGIRQQVKESVNEKLTAFAADYYRQNPQ